MQALNQNLLQSKSGGPHPFILYFSQGDQQQDFPSYWDLIVGLIQLLKGLCFVLSEKVIWLRYANAQDAFYSLYV